MNINLSTVPASIEKIAFSITIHDAEDSGQNFGQVSNSYVRILNADTGEEIIPL